MDLSKKNVEMKRLQYSYEHISTMIEGETWKDIPGFIGEYQVSDHGRVKSLKRTIIRSDGKPLPKEEKILTPFVREKGREFSCGIKGRGECIVNLGRSFQVHRLVAIAFIPNPDNKPCVNHIDGNPSNNHVSNLEWCTYKENTAHAVSTGLQRPVKGNDHGNSKLNPVIVREVRGSNVSDILLAKKYGVTHYAIYSIRKNLTWKHVL